MKAVGSSLFGYGAPATGSVSYTLTGGATFSGAIVLDNSSPADITQIVVPSGVTTFTLQALWSGAITPRCACLLGVTLPLGTIVTIKGKRAPGESGFPYVLGGNSQTTSVIQLDDGSSAVIWAFDALLDQILGYEITFTNGMAGLTGTWNIGEARIFQGYRPGRGIQEKWSPGFDNIQNPAMTVNRQPHVVNHRYNHNDSVIFGVANEKVAWTSDNGDISLNRFAHIAASHQTLLAIPAAYVNGVLNAQMLANTAIYGYASKVQRPQYVTNHYYQMSMDFVEYPPVQYG